MYIFVFTMSVIRSYYDDYFILFFLIVLTANKPTSKKGTMAMIILPFRRIQPMIKMNTNRTEIDINPIIVNTLFDFFQTM